MRELLTLVVALTYASMGGVFVGLGYLLRYRQRTDLMDTPSWRSVTDERELARYVGLWTALLGSVFLGMGVAVVGGVLGLTDTWAAFIVLATAYLAAVYYGNLAHSVPVASGE